MLAVNAANMQIKTDAKTSFVEFTLVQPFTHMGIQRSHATLRGSGAFYTKIGVEIPPQTMLHAML